MSERFQMLVDGVEKLSFSTMVVEQSDYAPEAISQLEDWMRKCAIMGVLVPIKELFKSHPEITSFTIEVKEKNRERLLTSNVKVENTGQEESPRIARRRQGERNAAFMKAEKAWKTASDILRLVINKPGESLTLTNGDNACFDALFGGDSGHNPDCHVSFALDGNILFQKSGPLYSGDRELYNFINQLDFYIDNHHQQRAVTVLADLFDEVETGHSINMELDKERNHMELSFPDDDIEPRNFELQSTREMGKFRDIMALIHFSMNPVLHPVKKPESSLVSLDQVMDHGLTFLGDKWASRYQANKMRKMSLSALGF